MNNLSQRIETLMLQAKIHEDNFENNKIISLIDHTRLDENDSLAEVIAFCDNVSGVASVCVYPQYVAKIKQCFPSLCITTVVNFPNGDLELSKITSEISSALQAGADEIDIVFPYTLYLARNKTQALNIIKKARELCTENTILKVILETEMFSNNQQIYHACRDCLELKVNFIKTSSGKRPIGATLESVATILLALKDAKQDAGCKVSGGIKSITQCHDYLHLAQSLFSKQWIQAQHFRFGSSRLLNLLKCGQ